MPSSPGGIPVIRMEYLPAGSVADVFGGGPAPVAEALHVLEESCRGVEALHARGVLHRDLKPANLLLGDGGRIKVSDFGLACHLTNIAGAPPWGYTEGTRRRSDVGGEARAKRRSVGHPGDYFDMDLYSFWATVSEDLPQLV